MIKPKLSKLVVLALMLFAFYGCTTKNEIPQPVVDSQHVDALRQQLIDLQQKVLGAQQNESQDSANLALTTAQVQAMIAQLQADMLKTVSYTVQVGSFTFLPLSGATVKLTQAGKIVSGTTAADGTTTFNGLFAGIVSGTVDLDGFTRLVFRADIRNTYDNANTYSTSSTVLLLPLGGTAQADAVMTTQYWKLYANYDITDDTLGGTYYWGANSTPAKALPIGPDVNNPTVSYAAVTTQTLTASIQDWSFTNHDPNGDFTGAEIPVGFTGWDVYNTGMRGNGQIVSCAFENAKWTATVSNGVYSMKLPATDATTTNVGEWETPATSNVGSILFILDGGEYTHDLNLYTDGSGPFIVKNATQALPTYNASYIYRLTGVGGYEWSSNQSTTLTSAWPLFFYSSLK